MTLDSNDKKIEPGRRTAFCVYLTDGGTNPKYQDVSFKCTLKKVTIYFDSTCAFNVQVEVKINDKVIVRARGANQKVEFDLTEPIFPNSRIKFESTEIVATAGWNALVFGEVTG